MALFGHSSGLVTELPTLAVLMAHFGHYIAKFDGEPSELPPGGSSNGTLFSVVELQTLAVLMALHQTWLCSGRNVPLELPRSAVL